MLFFIQSFVKKYYSKRHLLKEITGKYIKKKYSGSYLGGWWIIISPIILSLIIYFVFAKIFNFNYPYYPVFILAAMFAWVFFSNSISESLNIFYSERNLLGSVSSQPDIYVLATLLANLFSFLIALAIAAPLFMFFNPQVIKTIWLLPYIVFLHFIFLWGISLILACLNLFARDVSQIMPLLLMLWFWASPVFYSFEMVPSNYRWLIFINPLSYYFVFYRYLLFYGKIPPVIYFILPLFISFFVLILAYWIFNKLKPDLLKRL